MVKTLSSVGLKCPYMVRTAPKIDYNFIEERFDFQIEENGKIGRISLGKFDLIKEVNSHKDEVGLINALKLAEARGLSLDMFAKTEPGLMVDLSDIDTMDDLLKKKADAEAKLAKIAAENNMTVEELLAAVQAGKIEPKQEEGGAEDGTNA